MIYLDPEADEEALHALAGEVDSRPGVRSTAERGRDATYEDFQRLFADQEEMLANVQPEDLPLSVTAVVDSADAAALVTWARAESLVYDVSEFDAVRYFTELTRWLEREADRDELARFATLLRHVDGEPAWATVAADILDDARADGVGQVDADPQQVAEATAELARQVARC
ncbi:MAG: permease-like cell division protein FtsX [Acidimicrobiales bacterium]|nr:permease-like cell division protein FtsX [Acidimicrobiales bacterium]